MNINKQIYFLQNFQRSIFGHKAKNTNWNNIQLISIHIPKTAGTSFFHSLKQQYAQQVVRVDINREVWLNKISLDKAYLYPKPKVIHGHFTIDALKQQFDLPTNLRVITWLRDPVERVISNYFYLSKKLDETLYKRKKELKLLSRLKKTLVEFAQEEKNQNRMSKFLKGIELEDFFFIGFVESYDKDIQLLANKLNWDNVSVFQHNVTANKKKPVIDQKTKALIRSYNQKDEELYQKALRLRKS